MTISYPTPHGDKLQALLQNEKLPSADVPAVRRVQQRYDAWIAEMEGFKDSGDRLVEPMVASLGRYKTYVDLDLVFDSSNDFLYRQKGQLKLDNTIIEEFMPWLVGRVFSDQLMGHDLTLGPANCFAQLRFDSDLLNSSGDSGMTIRSKDQDFAITRPIFIRASHRSDFSEFHQEQTCLAYVAAEIKTNLDKTMFQEASATAYDLKLALPNSRYFLLCEWLDMTPISTITTSIEEVIVLRKAKRLSVDIRGRFSTVAGRAAMRDTFEWYLLENPFSAEAFRRFLSYVERILDPRDEDEEAVLSRGWF